jgi:alpha-glucosidase
VDGFRIDAVDFFGHDPQLRSKPAVAWTEAEPPAKPFALQRHTYDMMHPSIRDVLARLRSVVDRYPGRALLGELSSQPGADQRIASYCGQSGLHAAYTLSVAKKPLTAAAFAGAMTALSRPENICWSLSNHDVERAASRWLPLGADPERFNLLLAALFCALPGTVCLYQGEELALPNARLERDQLRDPFGITYWPEFQGRDGSRTPMPWRGDRPHAGFTRAGEPWLPVPDDHHALAVDHQERLPNSPLELWRRMLNVRRNHLALSVGTVEAIEEKGPVLAFERRVEGECLLLVFNLSNGPAEYSLKRKPNLLPLDLPRLPGTPTPEITADGMTLVLPPLVPFLALLRRG